MSNRRTVGRCRAIAKPRVNRRQPFVGSGTKVGMLTLSNATITKRYVAAFAKKNCAVVAPHCEKTATIIGPITREPLMTVLLSASAPDRSSGRTSEGNIADQAGAFIALPIPTPSAARNSIHTAGVPRARTASAQEKTSWTICIEMSHLRRSNLSAKTPAGIERKSNGPNCAKISKPTREALPVRL